MTRLLAGFGQDPARVEADIADEFAAHVELLERELVAAGHPPERAAVAARARFGDRERLARECRSIMLKEHTMLRRVHLAVTIVLAVLLVVSVLVSVTAARAARRAAEREREVATAARLQAEQAAQAEREARQAAEKARVGEVPVAPKGESK
jgi:hypothetical protein